MQLENVNSVSFSGHKFNGLKGQGILIIDNKEKLNRQYLAVVRNMELEVVL